MANPTYNTASEAWVDERGLPVAGYEHTPPPDSGRFQNVTPASQEQFTSFLQNNAGANANDTGELGYWPINGSSPGATLPILQKWNPGGQVVNVGGKQYYKVNPSGGWNDVGLSGSFSDFIRPLAMAGLAAGGAGLFGAFSGAAGVAEGAGAVEGAGALDFGTNAFEFGGVTGTTPLTGGSGFASSFASSISDLSSAFTKQFGLSPSNALSLAQKVSGAMGSQGGNGMIAIPGQGAPNTNLTQMGGSTSATDPIAGALGIGSGLLDLFSKGPFSSQGILDKAAGTADPIMGDRAGYGGMLKELMTNPDSFMLSPAAKTQMKYGTENLQRSDAAKGLLGSGNILADIMQFGEGVSSQDFWKQIDQLNLLSGAKTGSPPAAGQIMTGNMAGRNNAMSNIGGGLAALSPQVASILKSMGITDPSTYTAGNTTPANGYTYNPGDANMPGDLSMDVPNSAPLNGSFGDAASGSTLEDMFSFA